MALTVLVLLTALFFMGFFSIYIRRFADESSVDPTRRRGRGSNSSSTSSSGLSSNTVSYWSRGAAKGVDPSVVKGLKVQEYYNGGGAKQGMECAICLSEVEEREWIKELPVCGHVFHVECIDIWLESHVTCPLCRADVEVVREEGDVVEVHVDVAEVELGVGEVQGSESGEVRLEVDGRDTWRQEGRGGGEVGPVGVRRTSSCSWFGERVVLRRSLSF